jgi:hypothetical protein
MTVGELARLLAAEQRFGVDLTVVPCQGWSRSMAWEETGLPFIPPSPNMPTPDTVRVYPGMCLLEGTNLSEGRGTCRPFESRSVDRSAWRARKRLRWNNGAGRFVPTWDKHRGVPCAGLLP